MMELLVLLAILAGVLAMGALNGRRTLSGQEQAAFLNTLQNVFWQGATEAASRGENLTLERNGSRLELKRGSTVLRAWDIPQGVVLSLGDGPIARFTPPGKVQDPQGRPLSQPLTFTAAVNGRTYTYTISLIGEAKRVP
ncbi:type IV pilin [Thermus sp. 2.9]|nr:type IV pilin [Thermus sp. 2.9]